jgi:ubiquinol-cytochrome c reductase cytochrome b subunit
LAAVVDDREVYPVMSTVPRAVDAVDQRYHVSSVVKRSTGRVFSTRWLLLLGEIALYSFLILLLSVHI